MTIHLSGFRELDRALSELPKAAAKGVLRRVGKKALEPARAMASERAPENTGLLEGEVIISPKRKASSSKFRKKEGPSSVQLWMGPSTDATVRGLMQEFGTYKEPAQPFMRPAWDANADRALDIIKTELGQEIAKTSARRARKLAKG